MKKMLIYLTASFILLVTITILWIQPPVESDSDAIYINQILKEIELNSSDLSKCDFSNSPYAFSYYDTNNQLLYQHGDKLSNSLVSSIQNHIYVFPVSLENEVIGTLFVNTSVKQYYENHISKIKLYILSLLFIMYMILVVFLLWIHKTILTPFTNLKQFAKEISKGNLDFPLTMDSQNVFGAFTESFDIMRQELSLSKQKEYLANQSKKELIASLSHDLKTPITSIKITSELLLELNHTDSLNSDKLDEKLSTIYDNTEQINGLVNDLFHSSLEELGELSATPTDQYSKIIENIVKKADYFDRIHQLDIKACMIYADPNKLDQVLCNLVQNAYKYSSGNIMITSTMHKNTFELSVLSQGSQVLEDEIPLLFNKFYRGQNATSQSGAGLGLYICRQLLTLMNGEIYARNTKDGLEIIITLQLSS